MGKDKKDSPKMENGVDLDKTQVWEALVSKVSPIANPLASRKLTKKLYKVVKKSRKEKCLDIGVKLVQKSLKRNVKGIVLLAGDVTPVEVVVHLPCMCEDRSIPYCFVPARSDLGAALGSKRNVCAVLVKPNDEYKDLYNECFQDVKHLPLPI